MLIENAERFGLSQLHQLRGRVGRGSAQSYCILMTDHVTEDCRTRMQIMSRTNDGFQIAEADLQLRGPGDFFGQRQHGLPPLQIADLSHDTQLLHEVRGTAKKNSGKKMRICRLPNMVRCGWKYCVCSAAAAKMAEIRRFSCAYHTMEQC